MKKTTFFILCFLLIPPVFGSPHKTTEDRNGFLSLGYQPNILSTWTDVMNKRIPTIYHTFHFQYGRRICPRHILSISFMEDFDQWAFALSYSYEFIKSGDWIPGINISTYFGKAPGGIGKPTELSERESKLLPHVSPNRPLSFGGSGGLFLQHFISNNTALLLETGINHELIRLRAPQKISNLHIGFYIRAFARWYIH